MKKLEKLEGNPSPYAMLFNFGGIALFAMIPAILILWLVFDEFQNAAKPTTLGSYLVASVFGLIVQYFVRTQLGKPFYKHWTNAVFIAVLFVIGYLVTAEKFGL